METNQIINSEKQENYRVQMGRLSKALRSEFYLEAVFIAYAIIEDRTAAMLRYTDDFNPEKHNALNKKLNKLDAVRRGKGHPLQRYVSDELLSDLHEWKNGRNKIVHALLNQSVTTEELKDFAEKGSSLAKILSSKCTLYKRFLERRSKTDQK